MYSPRPIPKSFQKNIKKPKEDLSVPIVANEKVSGILPAKQQTLSPLAVLLFLDLFRKKKGDE